MTWEHLEPGSSPIDWCEGNYQVSANIAEFVNTVSFFNLKANMNINDRLRSSLGRWITNCKIGT